MPPAVRALLLLLLLLGGGSASSAGAFALMMKLIWERESEGRQGQLEAASTGSKQDSVQNPKP
jgi:hypothetical protein